MNLAMNKLARAVSCYRLQKSIVMGIGLAIALPTLAEISIPNVPLQSGLSVPPNVMLILDDSNSMAFDYLDDDSVYISGGGVSPFAFGRSTYTSNTLSYNPAVDYKPWVSGNGTLLPNTLYSAAHADPYIAGGGSIDLATAVRTFYVPKPLASDVSDATQYYRYQILQNGRVVRSERVEAASTTVELLNLSGLSAARNSWVNGDTGAVAPLNIAPGVSSIVTVPSGATSLIVSIAGLDLNANVFVRYGAPPEFSVFDCRRNNPDTSTETCTINSPAAGDWYIGVRAGNADATSSFANLQLTAEYTGGDPLTGEPSVGCDTTTSGWGWRNCVYATPTGRSEAAERQNYATWYSFHRTRAKSAKAGVTRAFSELGGDYRIGLSGLYDIVSPIPVNSDGGRFRNQVSPASSNRTDWFNSLINKGASSFGATPLRGALKRAGEYFSQSGTSGPYGGTGAVELSCRQNFAILTTDGYWNADTQTDFSTISGDESFGATITGADGQTFTYSPALPYSASEQSTLADVAMHYWKTDLRPSLDNNVPVSGSNPAFWQHMVTYGISLGLKGALNSPGDLACLTSGACSWPAPVNAGPGEGVQPANIDDLWHASVNGRGTFAAATNPDEFVEALRAALSAVVELTASGSNVTANSSTLNAETKLFQARYVSNRWIGELSAYAVDSNGVSATPIWSASSLIPAAADRKIFTWNGLGGALFPTAAQSAALDSPVVGVVDYLRGDQSQEISQGAGGQFRDRPHVLGDIVNSSPAYVKDTDTVYVGANDGMLHAFDAQSGVEVFAYVPGNIDLSALKTLANKNYVHEYFVDGPVVVSSANQSPNARNLLIGSLGRGGKGVYALDVTDPSTFDAGDVLWDFNATQHDLMGNVLGRPLIAKLNNGAYGVIVANGPNSSNDTAVLYVLDVLTGNVLAEVDTGIGDSANPNGLSTPRAWDGDGDGDVDIVYAGDLLGNMWAFDISPANTSSWSSSSSRRVVFQARSAAGAIQPISGGPTIALDPSTYKTWVFFGTGRLLNEEDLQNADGTPNLDIQSWYGVIDSGTTVSGRSELQQRKIVASATASGVPVRGFEPTSTLPDGKRGWYIDLVMPPNPPGTPEGERIVGDSALVGSTLFAASVIPTTTSCGQGGRGYINALDAFSGTSVGQNFFDVDGDGEFDDDNISSGGETTPVGSLDLGVSMPTTPTLIDDRIAAGGSDGSTGSVKVRDPAHQGRISWRELIGD